ncbi:MAG TPA: 6-bladed beta-propeller [Gemmatimonadales bacterium]|nr:6-bladed beta-propeller [Gemmatimonadales bacterium]
MSRIPGRAVAGLLALALAGCSSGSAAASNLAKAVFDTLPGGIVRVTSSGPTAWPDSAGAMLVEESRFSGEEGTPSELGNPQSIAVDEAGRVYVSDRKPSVIKVYGPDGTFIRTIGREGEGPGEFRIGFIAVRDSFLVLHDPQLSRTSVWDSAGTFLRSWHSTCCYWNYIQIDRQNRIYVPSMSPTKSGEKSRGTAYVRWSMEGVALDTVWIPNRDEGKSWTISAKSKDGKGNMMMSTSVPFLPGQTSALRPDGGVVYGWTGNYSIVQSALGTDTVRVFGRAWTPDPASDQRKRDELEGQVKWAKEDYGEAAVRAAFKLSDIPSTLPAFESLRVDRTGRVWARRYAVSDTTKTTFDAFDSTGAYLGPVGTALNLKAWQPQIWTRDGVVTITEDPDGRPTVVRLRLTIPGTPK